VIVWIGGKTKGYIDLEDVRAKRSVMIDERYYYRSERSVNVADGSRCVRSRPGVIIAPGTSRTLYDGETQKI